jgi:hypothetical protein
VRVAKLAPIVSRLGMLALISQLLLMASRAATSGRLPELALWLYAARLSLWAMLVIAAPSLCLYALEKLMPRGRSVATSLLLVGLVPVVRPIAVHLASGDGLRSRGVSATLVENVAFCVLLAASGAVWTYRYWARARPLDLSLGVLACAGLLTCAALLSRAQLELAAFLQALALALSVLVLHAGFGAHPRPLWRVALAGLAWNGALLLLGLALPAQLARGRRLSLLTESGLGLLAGQVVHPPDLLTSAPPPSAATCRRSLTPAALPTLQLTPAQRRNVILISIDTVRADYVQRKKPDGSPLMPAITGFMAESRAAARAHAAYPATLMSLSSAFTGNAPTDLLLTPKQYPTLFQLTREHFDHREVILPGSHYFARPEVRDFLLRDVEVSSAGGGRHQTRHAMDRLRELRAEGKSHFIWLHYFDPHNPYEKHPEYDFGDAPEQRYASELAHVDDTVAPLLELLRSEGWYEDSLIALFSDHGESFGEHEHFYHHYLLYPWLLSVPFALHAPGLEPGSFGGPVQLMDLTPTVLQFLGIAPTRPMRGLPLLAADPAPERALISEEISINGRLLREYRAHPVRSEADLLARMYRIDHGRGYVSKLAIARGALHLIQHRDSGAAELYQLAGDPRAERDLADARPLETRAMSDQLLALRRDMLLRSLCELTRASR